MGVDAARAGVWVKRGIDSRRMGKDQESSGVVRRGRKETRADCGQGAWRPEHSTRTVALQSFIRMPSFHLPCSTLSARRARYPALATGCLHWPRWCCCWCRCWCWCWCWPGGTAAAEGGGGGGCHGSREETAGSSTRCAGVRMTADGRLVQQRGPCPLVCRACVPAAPAIPKQPCPRNNSPQHPPANARGESGRRPAVHSTRRVGNLCAPICPPICPASPLCLPSHGHCYSRLSVCLSICLPACMHACMGQKSSMPPPPHHHHHHHHTSSSPSPRLSNAGSNLPGPRDCAGYPARFMPGAAYQHHTLTLTLTLTPHAAPLPLVSTSNQLFAFSLGPFVQRQICPRDELVSVCVDPFLRTCKQQ